MKKFVTLTLLAASVAAAADMKITSRIHIGAEGSWDYLYVDSAARRLYVSHATRIVVVDVDTEKVVGEIPDTQGVHGIALAPKINRGFTSNGRANNVTIVDLKTLKTVGQVKTGQNPDAIAYDEKTNRVITFNGRSKDGTVFEAETGKVIATIPFGGKPEFSAGDNKGKMWVNIEDTHEVAEVDLVNAKVTKRYTLAGCEEPSGLAMDFQRNHIFSVCGNGVMIVSDPAAGKVVAKLPIGDGADGVAFDPGTGMAYSSNGEGSVTAVQFKDGKYVVAATIPTQRGARTIAIDPKTHKLYLPTAKYAPAPPAAEGKKAARPTALPDSFMVLVIQ